MNVVILWYEPDASLGFMASGERAIGCLARSMEDFVRTLELVHYGSVDAVPKFAHLLGSVRLAVAVEKLPAPGERARVLIVREPDGRSLFPIFSGEDTLRRWDSRTQWGTFPALVIFETALSGPFDALVFNPAGPNRMEIRRDVLLTLVGIARSSPRS